MIVIAASFIGAFILPIVSNPYGRVIVGMPLTLLIVPILLVLVVGVIGMPINWPFLFVNSVKSLWPKKNQPTSNGSCNFVSQFFAMCTIAGITLYRLFVPQFFALTDKEYQKIPSNLKGLLWIFYKEPSKWYDGEGDIGPQPTSITDEVWIYVNGVATTKQLGRQHCEALNQKFGRKVLFCHNPTQSFFVDLLKCVHDKVGLFWNIKSEDSICILKDNLKQILLDAAATNNKKENNNKIKRIVVICHSQGTIITSNALKQLADEGGLEIQQAMKDYLETYAFANCAHDVSWGPHLKYQENISNYGDVVAWLGDLFPFPKFWTNAEGKAMRNDQTQITVRERWFFGHLLMSHYLDVFDGNFKGSRLHQYKGGKSPLNYKNDYFVFVGRCVCVFCVCFNWKLSVRLRVSVKEII